MASRDVLSDDTRGSLASGRRLLGDVFVTVRSKLRRLFIIFLVALLATVYALRLYIWPKLEADLLAQGAEIIVLTPFDVILLQAKIGILIGILSMVPLVMYYARDPLKRRGWYPEDDIPRWKLAAIGSMAVVLFFGGVVYSYNIFFPVMFAFLAHHTESVGLVATYSLVDWTQFILVLSLSFGFAAQLPLVMTALSYSGIVRYETFRDKWKYAVLGMFGFGALFSPPDPFTQLMWAAPLVVLYGLSLYFSRLAVAFKRGRATLEIVGNLRRNFNKVLGVFVLAGGITGWIAVYGERLFNEVIRSYFPSIVRPSPISFPLEAVVSTTSGLAVVSVIGGGIVALIAVLYYAWPRFGSVTATDPVTDDIIDLSQAGVGEIRTAPDEVIAELGDDEVLALSREAMDAGEPEKAKAIFERYDAIEAEAEDESDDEATSGAVTQTTTNVVNAISEEERTEDDIGGYYYDILFILDTLRSRTFRLFAVFILVLVGVFWFLYQGGLGIIKSDFLARLPDVVEPENINVITLHPVEALVFSVKISTLLGAIATFPVLLYYAWPPLKERGIASGDRRVFFGWTGALAISILGGSLLGYLYIAPGVISYLVWDAVEANMIISYRVSNFFWLIFFTTVGIGLWISIPVTMVMFHRGGILHFDQMRSSWRGVTVGVLAVMAMFTPSNVLSMVLVAIPVMLGYGLGLGILWLYTIGSRRTHRLFSPSS